MKLRRPSLRWSDVTRATGLTVVIIILGLVVLDRHFEPLVVQTLLVIAAGLLGLGTFLKRNGH